MGFKGYRLWAMGQLDSTCSAPPWELRQLGQLGEPAGVLVDAVGNHIVALQVAFKRQTLKPGFHLIGYRL
jgi:hypothetical protein